MKKEEIDRSDKYNNFAQALEAANIGVWELNGGTMELSLSHNIFGILGISRNSFKGSFESFIDLIHPGDRTLVKDTINFTLKKRKPFDTEFRIIVGNGKERWFRIRGDINISRSGREIKILGSLHDKTERKLAFDTLEERVRERTSELEEINRKLRLEISENRKMKKMIMEISDKERQKIGQDLHDTLSQQLGGILFMIQTLGEKLKQKKVKENADLENIKKHLSNTLKYVRNISKGLYLTFGETGLKFALTELIEQINELYGMEVELQIKNWRELKDENVSTNIFRIIQEALNNAVKHSNSKKAAIFLSRKGKGLILKINDFGRGFPPNPNRKGLGLKIMEYRASQIGGNFRLESIPGKGTEITCEFDHL